jgi:hypothetical protein
MSLAGHQTFSFVLPFVVVRLMVHSVPKSSLRIRLGWVRRLTGNHTGHGSWLAINRSSSVVAYEQRARDERDCFLHPSFLYWRPCSVVVGDTKHQPI